MTTHVTPRSLSISGLSASSASTSMNPTKLRARIGRTYRFESAHYLPLVPDGHKCKNLHGHNYRVEIIVQGEVDCRGFVKDFAEVDAEVVPLLRILDHRLLNDVEGLENPTAEIIANWFLARIVGCERVRVYENDDCWAEVTNASQD
jgi:6-pyruvoyltetrahydropterin/6-carboxytetrahydropterin synthase